MSHTLNSHEFSSSKYFNGSKKPSELNLFHFFHLLHYRQLPGLQTIESTLASLFRVLMYLTYQMANSFTRMPGKGIGKKKSPNQVFSSRISLHNVEWGCWEAWWHSDLDAKYQEVTDCYCWQHWPHCMRNTHDWIPGLISTQKTQQELLIAAFSFPSSAVSASEDRASECHSRG